MGICKVFNTPRHGYERKVNSTKYCGGIIVCVFTGYFKFCCWLAELAFMNIKIVTVGKKHDVNIGSAIDEYTARVARVLRLEWEFIPASGKPEHEARKEESAQIIQKLKSSDVVWLLDERGSQITSLEFASKLNVMQTHSVQNLILVIGGAYGVDDTLRSRADFVWSLSKLVLPHQLTRLVLAEQIYRATEINRGSGYHHA
jgi:23S rRNA (pseudouridine1915-N3)-methyltransferase